MTPPNPTRRSKEDDLTAALEELRPRPRKPPASQLSPPPAVAGSWQFRHPARIFPPVAQGPRLASKTAPTRLSQARPRDHGHYRLPASPINPPPKLNIRPRCQRRWHHADPSSNAALLSKAAGPKSSAAPALYSNHALFFLELLRPARPSKNLARPPMNLRRIQIEHTRPPPSPPIPASPPSPAGNSSPWPKPKPPAGEVTAPPRPVRPTDPAAPAGPVPAPDPADPATTHLTRRLRPSDPGRTRTPSPRLALIGPMPCRTLLFSDLVFPWYNRRTFMVFCFPWAAIFRDCFFTVNDCFSRSCHAPALSRAVAQQRGLGRPPAPVRVSHRERRHLVGSDLQSPRPAIWWAVRKHLSLGERR